MNIRIVRQGDILIILHKELPDEVRNRKIPFLKIEGENGNSHTLIAEEVEVYENIPNQSWFARIGDKPGYLTHPEHPDIRIKPHTIVEVRRMREYNPFETKMRTYND